MQLQDWMAHHHGKARERARNIEEVLGGDEATVKTAARDILSSLGDVQDFLTEQDHVFLAALRERLGDLAGPPLNRDNTLRQAITAHIRGLDACLQQGRDARPYLQRLVRDLTAWADFEETELVPWAAEMPDYVLEEVDRRLEQIRPPGPRERVESPATTTTI